MTGRVQVGLRRSCWMAGVLLAVGCGGEKVGGPTNGGGSGRVAFIGLEGVPESKQLFVGVYLPLAATTYDRDHLVVTGVPVTWSSSDTTKATVAGGQFYGEFSGQVYGKAPGTVVITATSDGQKATTSLTIVPVPIASVTVTPSTFGSYTGLKPQLTTTVVDELGRVRTDCATTWTSSDERKATVDATGQVTAVAAGTVTITATCDGKSGTANLTVLARPTADWSGVTSEWVTFQGNGSHTGYVPASVDPVAFAHRWTLTVAAGVALNPVTAGDGTVFVSTNGYFGTNVLTALSAVDGARKWRYDFGPIHSVHPPAFDGGSVYVATSGHEDSFIWGFDASAGTVRFRTSYGNQWSRYFAPVVVDQSVYMAGGYYGGMYAFSTTDGAQRWTASLNQYDEWTPAVRDGLVYAYTGEYSPNVTVADATTGAVLYEIADPSFNWTGWSMGIAPVLGTSNNLLATQGSRLLSFDLSNRRVGWQLAGSFSGNVTVADGVLYVFNNQQVEARRESDGSLLWIWIPPEGEPQGTMVVTRNVLFVSTAANTYAVDLGARVHGWSYPAGGSLALSQQGVLFIAQSNGKLTAIKVQ
jgi:hypothetical protein